MRRIIIASIIGAAIVAGGPLATQTRVVHGLIFPITPYDADVNKDGHVNSTDQLNVAQNYGKPVVPPLLGPTIVGNRAFTTSYGGPMQLVNTDDGSVVVTFPVGVALGQQPFSCDGSYAAILTPSGSGRAVSIIKTSDGSTAAADATVNYGPSVQFTCPLKGSGAQFGGVVPVANRAVVQGLDLGIRWHFRVLDLTTGQTLYTNDDSDGSSSISCAQNTVTFGNLAATAITVVRLTDGGVVAPPVGGGPSARGTLMTTC